MAISKAAGKAKASSPLRKIQPPAARTFAAQCAPSEVENTNLTIPPISVESKFDYTVTILTTTDPVRIAGKCPKTQTEMREQEKEWQVNGLLLSSEDGLTFTTWMPNSILRVVWSLRPTEPASQ